MTLALRELQAAFVAHLVDGDRADLVAAVAGDSIPAAARLRIHRHHLFDSLVIALGTTFPTVQRLVGNDFFRGLARTFIAENLPAQPVLSEYGADFPAFVERHESVHALAYLADVARLDWALNVAFHGADGPRLGPAQLEQLSIGTLAAMPLPFAPGTTLLCSAHPLDRIWAISQQGVREGMTLDGTGVRLLVFRNADDASFLALDEGEGVFAASLIGGKTLEHATENALDADPGFDLSRVFPRFVALRLFAAPQQM
jgi:hypothetical protein